MISVVLIGSSSRLEAPGDSHQQARPANPSRVRCALRRELEPLRCHAPAVSPARGHYLSVRTSSPTPTPGPRSGATEPPGDSPRRTHDRHAPSPPRATSSPHLSPPVGRRSPAPAPVPTRVPAAWTPGAAPTLHARRHRPPAHIRTTRLILHGKASSFPCHGPGRLQPRRGQLYAEPATLQPPHSQHQQTRQSWRENAHRRGRRTLEVVASGGGSFDPYNGP